MAETATGRLAASAPGTTLTTLYAPTSGKKTTCTLQICNQAAAAASYRVALIDAATVASVASEDYLHYDTPLDANMSAQVSGITIGNGECIGVYGSAATVSFVLWGIEEDL